MRTARGSAAPLMVLAAAAAVRLAVLLVLPPQLWVDGSDTPYYVRQGWLLAHGSLPLLSSVAPGYIWLLAAAWGLFPAAPSPESAGSIAVALLTVVRIVQVLCSVGMIAAAVALARRWTGNRSAALVTGLGLALGPAFVVEPFRVLTETVFLTLLVLGLLLHTTRRGGPAGAPVVTGVVFGLAALVRPVVLALPIVLAGGRWLCGDDPRRRRGAVLLLLAFTATVAPWSVSLRRHTGSWLPPGLAANLWIGAVGDGRWHGTEATDSLRSRFAGGPDDYLGEVAAQIRDAPGRWLLLRLRNLGAALVQPHLAADVSGTSTRQAITRWWQHDRGPRALLSLALQPSVLLKLALYGAHWLALIGGLAGLLRWRRSWRDLLPLWAVILYFPCVHFFLSALPRYLLPMQPALWVAIALLLQPPPGAAAPAAAATLVEDG